ncbi:hypothetical protein CRUP_010294 [Coryphaenoides rupestris]|nr:hypothetical protein CRUP_010294 [Coryphaenoides rupestris]
MTTGLRKRKNCRGPSLIPLIKQEKRDGSTNSDAYVAFRRRTEKMQTRKNRKNDEASYEKMLKLRREFSRTVTILEMIKRREKAKRELLHLTLEVAEKRYQLGDFNGEVLGEVTVPLAEKPAYIAPVSLANGMRHKADMKSKTHKARLPHAYQVSMKDEFPFDFVRPKKKYTKRDKLTPCAGPAAPRDTTPSTRPTSSSMTSTAPGRTTSQHHCPRRRSRMRRTILMEFSPSGGKAGCQYLSPCVGQSQGLLREHPELAGLDPLHHRHSLTALCLPRHCIGLARRRMGRGGRVILDRASSAADTVLRQLDPDVVTAPGTTDSPGLTQRAPGPRCAPGSSLSEILDNIQARGWRCLGHDPLRTTAS